MYHDLTGCLVVRLGRNDGQDFGGIEGQEDGLVTDKEAVEERVRGVCCGVLYIAD